MKITPSTDLKLAIQGATVLTPAGWLLEATVLIADGKFVALDPAVTPNDYMPIDATGLWMLPGIVDIHGDAFERMICPRPGVSFPLDMALIENDRALLSAGITTFFYSITDSFEPGLRSRDTLRQILHLVTQPNELRANSYIHVRHEQAQTEDYEELVQWLESGKIDLLSLNNHLPDTDDPASLARHTKGRKQRLALSEPEIYALLQAAMARQDRGLQQVEQLVQLAHQVGVPIASHDDDSPAAVALSARRKVAIAEFPASIALADQSQDYGAAVLMGAPNLVRGGSHVGYMSVAAAVQAGVLDCLCSDYHYPSLFYAPFKLTDLELMPFEDAWQLVSTHPAQAAGLGDRKGSIATGLDADFLLVQPDQASPAAIQAVYIQGQERARYA